MKENRLRITKITVTRDTITCTYRVSGPWSRYFYSDNIFCITYSDDISSVPESVAAIPFLCNILPIAWLNDGVIELDECDGDFYRSIPEFKKGYEAMYPMLTFSGELAAGAVIENGSQALKGSAAFFSGGVDAFSTLISHMEEKPRLLTLWGADIKLDNKQGWEKVSRHLHSTADLYGLGYVEIKSPFREFINEAALNELVKDSGDGWWHGFQHGIGLIGHAAPYLYAKGLKTVYIASSLSPGDQTPCASYPTIDDHVRFCGCRVVHDGFDYRRQDKVRSLCNFTRDTGTSIPLRVCWQSSGGTNCCKCEKCARTMLAIQAEGLCPSDFGFEWNTKTRKQIKYRLLKYERIKDYRWQPIIDRMRETHTTPGDRAEWGWLINKSIEELNNTAAKRMRHTKCWKLLRKIKRRLIGSGQ